MLTALKPETSKITMKKVVPGKNKSDPTKKIRPEKMKILTLCFDPLERRGIPDLVWVATGDGVSF